MRAYVQIVHESYLAEDNGDEVPGLWSRLQEALLDYAAVLDLWDPGWRRGEHDPELSALLVDEDLLQLEPPPPV